ncbi:hypothetical protein [Corallococcus sp. RDP092CA]|uniref:hypothetical protein n=1 Tax=Corallococcus sp. RDP092CA TaxID=3109369 RepID=UPI0035B03F09
MKNWKLWMVAVMGGLSLMGCGEQQAPNDGAETPAAPTGFMPALSDDVHANLAENQYEVRILGVGSHRYQGAYVNVDSMTVSAGGRELPVEMKATVMDLARPDHAALVGYFTLPPGVDSAEVVIRFDEYGAFEDGQRIGALDVRTAPLRFEVTRALLAPRKHAVVQLDLARSVIIPRVGDAMMMPTSAVAF